MTISSHDLEGKRVLTQDGREVGEVDALEVDVESWAVSSVHVKLKRDVLEELKLKRPLVGSQTVQVDIQAVSGVSDALVLKTTLGDLSFVGGTPAGSSEE